MRNTSILSSERTLQKDYDCKSSVAKKKTSGHDPRKACRQDEMIGGKPPVLK
jgi:hypothetical protein